MLKRICIERLFLDDEEIIRGQYLRQCESQLYAQSLVEHELSVHGNNYANFPRLLCDYDGSYGVYTVNNGMCVDLTYSNLKNTFKPANNCFSELIALGETTRSSVRGKWKSMHKSDRFLAVSALNITENNSI